MISTAKVQPEISNNGAVLSDFVGLVSPLSQTYKGREVKVFEFSPDDGASPEVRRGIVVEVYLSKFEGTNGNASVCLIKYKDDTTELVDLRQGRVYPLDGAPIPKVPFRDVWFTPGTKSVEKVANKPQFYYTTPFKLKSLLDCVCCDYLCFVYGKAPDPPIHPDKRVRVKKQKKVRENKMIWPWDV
jgi:hypothetical protein